MRMRNGHALTFQTVCQLGMLSIGVYAEELLRGIVVCLHCRCLHGGLHEAVTMVSSVTSAAPRLRENESML
ncbi:hypothetical protein FHT07_001621 [Xanthomonas arboricola]|nr:hypothetical protein [Xanthomonas arboricola]NIK50590.1 hypothetical protein [Xanthomonas arboricola]